MSQRPSQRGSFFEERDLPVPFPRNGELNWDSHTHPIRNVLPTMSTDRSISPNVRLLMGNATLYGTEIGLALIYCISDPDRSHRYDARIEFDGSSVSLHSRGGATGGRPPRNTEYERALLTIIRRLRREDKGANSTIGRVLLDSTIARRSSRESRTLAVSDEFAGLSDEAFAKLIRQRAKSWGQDPSSKGGNSTKALRFEVQGLSLSQIKSTLKLIEWSDEVSASSGVERLPNAQLRKVTSEHIKRAIERILGGERAINFSESTDYDVLLPDGTRLAPKKIFGLALSETLGIEAMPKHFSAGLNQPCFDIIQAAGFHIVLKSIEPPSAEDIEQALRDAPLDASDRLAIEGNPKIVTHMRRERAAGLARQKKAAFAHEHGELFCERCGFRPEPVYGQYLGGACIEVHHARVQVKDMRPGHETSLDDLQCLCANCHRITHREMTLGIVTRQEPLSSLLYDSSSQAKQFDEPNLY